MLTDSRLSAIDLENCKRRLR